jgi:citrate synthase
MTAVAAKGGLEGIVAGASALCDIDGRSGRLLYCGYDIVDLAAHSTFEETAWLLWHGELPNAAQLADLSRDLRAHLAPHPAVWDVARAAGPDANPMAVLRTQVSLLGALDPLAGDNSEEANRRKAARLVAQTGTLVAGTERVQQGLDPVAPRPDLSLAANFLHMLHGSPADDEAVRTFDVALVLHAEHGMNASTFAARVTAATLSDMHSAITSAIGALKGPLHGGANERVMELLRELPDVESTPAVVREMLAQKRRIMGFGHRVYRTEDPRATILREHSRRMGERAGDVRWYELTRAVEQAVLEEKGLYPNVDLYSASTYTCWTSRSASSPRSSR